MKFLPSFWKKKQKIVIDDHDIEMIVREYLAEGNILGDCEEFTRDVIMIIVGNKSKYATVDTIEKEVSMFLCAHNSMCLARIEDDLNKQRDKDKETKHIEIIKETVRESVKSAVRSEMSEWAKNQTVSSVGANIKNFDSRQYRCPNCQWIGSRRQMLAMVEINDDHFVITENTGDYACPNCGKRHKSLKDYEQVKDSERVDDQNSQYLSAMADIKKELEINPRPENSGPRPIYSVFDNRCLTVRIKDGHYQWACDPYTWEEIPKYLYDALIRFDNE